MMYRLILAKGGGKIPAGMAENTAFPNLWGTLMVETADFLERSQGKVSADRHVSRLPVYQATKQLQYNLTEHTTGMSHAQITEMYHHLREAKSVLGHAVDYFSTGPRKSLWTVVERASREWFDEAPNISAIRSAAIDGNRVFQWIANFDQSNVTDEQFQTFIDAVDAWIVAEANHSDPTRHEPDVPNEGSEEDSVDSGDADLDK